MTTKNINKSASEALNVKIESKKVAKKEEKQKNTYNQQIKYQNCPDFNENDSDIAYNITKYRYGHRNIM